MNNVFSYMDLLHSTQQRGASFVAVIDYQAEDDVIASTWASSDLAGGGHGQALLTHSVMSRRPRPHEVIPRLSCAPGAASPRPAPRHSSQGLPV